MLLLGLPCLRKSGIDVLQGNGLVRPTGRSQWEVFALSYPDYGRAKLIREQPSNKNTLPEGPP